MRVQVPPSAPENRASPGFFFRVVCFLQDLPEICFARGLPAPSRRILLTYVGAEEPLSLQKSELITLLGKSSALLFCESVETFARLRGTPGLVDEEFLRLCFPSSLGSVAERVDHYLSVLSTMPTTLLPLLKSVFNEDDAIARFLEIGLGSSTRSVPWEEYICSGLENIKKRRSEEKAIDLLEAVKLVFAENGLLEDIHPGYEFRQEQFQTSLEVAESIALEKGILLESGTGTGKTLAYLVPVAYHVVSSKRRAVVSTRTRTLQDQLMQKDVQIMRNLPELKEVRVTSLKGRERYLCPNKLLGHAHIALLDNSMNPYAKEMLALVLWSISTRDGDLDRIRISQETRSSVSASRFECGSRSCGDRGRCPYYRARENSRRSDIVITNHALLSSEIQMKSPEADSENGVLLPSFDVLVIDEAHGFEKALTDTLTFSISPRNIKDITEGVISVTGKVLEQLAALFDETFIESAKSRISLLHKETVHAAKMLASLLHSSYTRRDMILQGALGEEARSLTEKIDQLLRAQASMLVQLDEMLSESSRDGDEAPQDSNRDVFRTLRSQVFEIIKNTSGVMTRDDNRIVFLSPSESNRNGALCSAPVGNDTVISDVMRAIPIKIFISATMWVFSRGSDGFNYSRRILGLGEDFHALKLGTSFDFGNQLRLMLLKDMPEYFQNSLEYIDNGAEFICNAINIVGGGSAVLFTSYSDMKQVESRLSNRLKGVDLHVQRPFESASVILSEHVTNEKSVIFGTRTFWEGIDLPGDKLKLLIIFKLPFDRPDEPLTRARIRHYGERSFVEGLHKYYYPKMITLFRQGIGRVIRTREDHGVIIVLDKRIVDPQRNYSVKLLNSLPAGLLVERITTRQVLTNLRNLKKTGWLT